MYIHLLTQIKNAQEAKKESIKIPYSKMDEDILEILEKNGYVKNFEKKGRGARRILEIDLKYFDDKKTIEGVKFISKSSRRLYAGYKELRPVKHGYGLLVVSTPKGILSGKEAKKMKVGGEVLFQIW